MSNKILKVLGFSALCRDIIDFGFIFASYWFIYISMNLYRKCCQFFLCSKELITYLLAKKSYHVHLVGDITCRAYMYILNNLTLKIVLGIKKLILIESQVP